MTLKREYFFGQGCVYICKRDNTGRKTECMDAQDVSSLTISPSETTVEHREHCSGSMLTDQTVNFQPDVSLNIVFDNFDHENLAFFYKGTASEITAGTVTGEAHTLGADKIAFLDETNVDLTPANICLLYTSPSPRDS